MTARTDVTDAQWKRLQPLLPPPKARGRPRNDDRHTLNGILFLLRTGAPWRDLPRRYGPYSVVWQRLHDWQVSGDWARLWQAFLGTLDAQAQLDWGHCALDSRTLPAKGGATRWDTVASAE